MTDKPRTAVEAREHFLRMLSRYVENDAAYRRLVDEFTALTNEAADERLRAALARWLPPDVYQAGEFMRRNHRDITLSEYDADCALLAATEDRPDDPSFYGEEMDGFNMTERNADGSVVEP